jgi:eukaryotic-like serine/threonine-protein kinase
MISIEPGARIAGRFVVEARLGAGGMGVVVAARDERLGRTVAIKLLPARAVGSAEARARLLHEARAAAALDHPGIVRIHDAGETAEGDAYLVMELVKGLSFGALLAEGTLSLAARIQVIVEAAAALESAHRRGFVHRDVKPENIMVRADGHAVVLDFGIVKHALALESSEVLTSEGMIVGTPAYLAPEQAGGRASIDGRADQFGLAVTAYKAVTGRLPWQIKKRGASTLWELQNREPIAPRAVVPELSLELEAALLKALARDPEARYPTLSAFAADLVAASNRGLIAALPLHRGELELATLPVRSVADEVDLPPASDPATRDAPTSGAYDVERPLERDLPAQSERSASPPARAGAGRHRRWLALVATLAAVAVGLPLRADHRSPAPAPAPRGVDPSALLACPPLAVARGVAEPSGWLGAAAASVVCNSAADMRGGRLDRVLVPAELLDLPRSPTTAFPVDPFGERDARARAIAAARARARAYVDGELSRDEQGFHVELILRASDDSEIARAHGEGELLHLAVRSALDRLLHPGALAPASAVDPALADWLGTDRLEALRIFHEYEDTELYGVLARRTEICQRARADSDDELGSMRRLLRIECGLSRVGDESDVPSIPVDSATPGALALTARYHTISSGGTDTRALAKLLAEARAREKTPFGVASLAEAEAEMLQIGRSPERARELALLAVEVEPKLLLGWRQLTSVAFEDTGAVAVLRGFAAWFPAAPMPWRWLATGTGDAPVRPEERLGFARRAYLLSPRDPGVASLLADLLVLSGEREEARAVGAALLSSEDAEERAAGELIMTSVDESYGHFGAALKRARRVVGADDSLAQTLGAARLVEHLFRLAILLGRETEIADEIVARFIEPAPRVDRFRAPLPFLLACMTASPGPSRRCFASLHELLSRDFFVGLRPSFPRAFEGAERLAQGDARGAARAWRAVVSEGGITFSMLEHPMVTAFDRAGEPEIAEQIDAEAMRRAASWNGATLGHLRAARRAAAAGDRARAAALVKTMKTAWLTADEPIPPLQKLQAR